MTYGLSVLSHTAVTLGVTLVPFSLEAPGSETLVAGIVAGEVAVLDESLLVMATGDEVDLLVKAHIGRLGWRVWEFGWTGWVKC